MIYILTIEGTIARYSFFIYEVNTLIIYVGNTKDVLCSSITEKTFDNNNWDLLFFHYFLDGFSEAVDLLIYTALTDKSADAGLLWEG